MKLPNKPIAVAHVSDAHWKAALDAALYSVNCPQVSRAASISHARCLIMLGEVPEPVDPIDAAIEAVWNSSSEDIDHFGHYCYKHFAGLKFPGMMV